MKKIKFTHLKFLPAVLLLFLFHSSFAQVTLIADNTDIRGGNGNNSVVLPGNIPIMFSHSGLLYTTNGTSANVISNDVLYDGGIADFGIYKGEFYFSGVNTTNHQALWATDGKTVRLVNDINPSGNADILHYFLFNNLLYFTANDGVHGIELWVTDGTIANTHAVTDINGFTTPSISDNVLFFVNGDYALFNATGANGVPGFYKLTSSGVSLIKSNFTAGLGYYSAGTYYTDDATALGSKTLFGIRASTYSTHLQLWITDGSTAGTFMLKDFGANSFNGHALQLVNLNSKIIFDGYSAATGVELWSTDGTVANTVLVKDINDSASGSSNPALFNATKLNNKLYFDAYNSENGEELWSTDGTTAGTALLKDINPGNKDATPFIFENTGAQNRLIQNGQFLETFNVNNLYSIYNNKFYFTADNGTNGRQLWSSNGTDTGTQMVKIINPKGDAFDANIDDAFYTTTGIYFSAFDSLKGIEPWVTNGTAAGTSRVYDVNPGIGGSYPSFQFIYNSQLYFTATNNDTIIQLYKINTPLTVLPLTLLSFNVVKQNNSAQLTWQTANEINTSHFNIQRSTDAIHFSTVGEVTAKGSSKVTSDYAFADDVSQLHTCKVYYRLQITDNDGKSAYSSIKYINVNGGLSIAVAPDPIIGNNLNLNIYSPSNAKLQLVIYNELGKLMLSQQFNMLSGSLNKAINFSNVAAGSYFLRITDGTSTQTIKFLKQ